MANHKCTASKEGKINSTSLVSGDWLVNGNYLSVLGSGNPFRVHVILGVGLPRAEHLRETSGPGCMV